MMENYVFYFGLFFQFIVTAQDQGFSKKFNFYKIQL
jgi:hypothetical protein